MRLRLDHCYAIKSYKDYFVIIEITFVRKAINCIVEEEVVVGKYGSIKEAMLGYIMVKIKDLDSMDITDVTKEKKRIKKIMSRLYDDLYGQKDCWVDFLPDEPLE